MCVLPECMHCTTCVWYSRRSEEGIIFPGTGVPESCEPTCGCWELNLYPLQEQQVLLTAEPSFLPHVQLLTRAMSAQLDPVHSPFLVAVFSLNTSQTHLFSSMSLHLTEGIAQVPVCTSQLNFIVSTSKMSPTLGSPPSTTAVFLGFSELYFSPVLQF